ncbi:hypothetical protein JMJ77_0011907, partial [Colletotrichum scovillei]
IFGNGSDNPTPSLAGSQCLPGLSLAKPKPLLPLQPSVSRWAVHDDPYWRGCESLRCVASESLHHCVFALTICICNPDQKTKQKG